MTGVRVTVNTLRQGRICLSGARRGCRQLGLDFRRLVTEGYLVEELRGIDDVTVKRLIAIAENGDSDGRR